MTTKAFFVYGSYCQGQMNHSKIQNRVIETKNASILGTCYRTKLGYPVAMEGGTDAIPGELVHLDLSTVTESFFDELQGHNPMDQEGSLTLKKTVPARTENGETVEAFVYFLNPLKKPAQMQKIEGGDWRPSLVDNPPLPQKLSERQKSYVSKLFRCSGRDIVPIDMILYRELMNLELIVDKGRRLALSKLGLEVCRYIE